MVLTVALSLVIVYIMRHQPAIGTHSDSILGWMMSLRFLPPVAVAIPLYVMARSTGLYNHKMLLVLIYTASSMPLAAWMLRGFTDEIPRELEEAAFVDGAGHVQVFWRVVLPLLMPGILAAAVLTLALTWGEFVFALTLTATPEGQTFPIAVWGYVSEFQISYQDMAAAGLLAASLPMLLFLVARRHVITALTFGAVTEK